MRAIKFRAYVKETNEVFPVGNIYFFDEDVLVWGCGNEDCGTCGDLYPLSDVILLQYTGLKDKNGKEIYEGDIIENVSDMVNFQGVKISGKSVKRYRIGWHEKGKWHSFRTHSNNHKGIVGVYKPEIYSEVIGNIYENPELLNGDAND